MHVLGTFAPYWWVLPLAMALIVGTFVLAAGRGAEGGFGARVQHGWGKWRALSHNVGEFQGRVVLTIFYFTVVAPFGLARTYLADPLRLKRANQTQGWLTRQPADLTLHGARRQF